MFRSYDHLHAEIYTSEIKTLNLKSSSIPGLQAAGLQDHATTPSQWYFVLKMVVRPKHVADNLNKIVNNY
jgi:hypothetical protein